MKVEQAADVGVGDPPGELHLLAEAGQGGGVGGDLRADGLYGDSLTKFLVDGLVHLTHPAAPQGTEDAKTAVEHTAGLEGIAGDVGRDLKKTAGALVLVEEALDFGPEVGVGGVGLVQEGRALGDGPLERGGEQLLDPVPPGGGHERTPLRISPWSQARARVHSRSTVRRESAST